MKPRWKSGSMGMLTVNALFAAFSGALLIGLALSPPPAGAMWFDLSSFFAFGALASFALAAEWITDALDEDSLPKYLRSMALYNLGVVLVFAAIGFVLIEKEYFGPGILALVATTYWINHFRFLVDCSDDGIRERRAYEQALGIEERTGRPAP